MLSRLLKRLSYANVIATLALFIALGGVSYAASIAPKNSVRSSSIKNGQVKTPDLANNAVTSAKIKNGQVASVDLAAALKADLNDAATLGGKSAAALSATAFQAKQSGILTLTGTQQAAATLALPTAGTYLVTYSAKAEGSDTVSTHLANIDAVLKAGGTTLDAAQALFAVDVPTFIIFTGEESITRQVVITTSGAVTLTLAGNTHFGNTALTPQIASGVITALKVPASVGATVVP